MNQKEKREILPIRFGADVGVLTVRRWMVERPRGRVICAHGIGSTGAEFALLAVRLNALGFEVIVPDWIGHGDSQYLWQAEHYGWESYVRCLTAVARKYQNDRTHYVGISWGGMILLFFLNYMRTPPRSAVFIDVPFRRKPTLSDSSSGLRVQSAAAFDTVEEIEEFLYSRRPELRDTPAEWRDYFRKARFDLRDGKFVMRFDPAAIEALNKYADLPFNNYRGVARINCDALFLYGKRSPYRDPVQFAQLRARHPNIEYAIALDAAHPPVLYTDEQLSPITDFIDRKAVEPAPINPEAGS